MRVRVRVCVVWGSGTVLAGNGQAAVAQALVSLTSNLHDLDLRRGLHLNHCRSRCELQQKLTHRDIELHHATLQKTLPASPQSAPSPSVLQPALTSCHHLNTTNFAMSPTHPPIIDPASNDVVDCGADRNTGMTPAAWAGLLGAPGLAGLTRVNSLSWTHRTDGLSWTGRNKMSNLDLSREQLGPKGVVEAVAGMLLKHDATLTKLDLRCRGLGACNPTHSHNDTYMAKGPSVSHMTRIYPNHI